MWLELNKSPAVDKPVETPPPPAKVYICLSQHSGGVPTLCTTVGSHVLMGQPLASGGKSCCDVFATVSGIVCDIREEKNPYGKISQMVIIENDGLDEPYQGPCVPLDPAHAAPKQIIEKVRAAALGSAKGFSLPLFRLMEQMASEKTHVIVLNGVETEPYVSISQKILDENPNETMRGLFLVMQAVGAKRAVLALSDDIPDEIALQIMENAKPVGINLKTVFVPAKYPAGYEPFVSRMISGDESEIGYRREAGFVYAEDCLNVYRAVYESRPQLTKLLTVAGDAVQSPQNLEVRIGTPIGELLSYCGLAYEPDRVALGSALHGEAANSFETPVTKAFSAVLALKKPKEGHVHSICVNCGRCVAVCPERLMPNYIAMRAVNADFEACRSLQIHKCMECGLCGYVCPGRMPLLEIIKKMKKADI